MESANAQEMPRSKKSSWPSKFGRTFFLTSPANVNAEQIYKTSQMLSNITGILVQPNKAIIGKNASAHEAGIHQDGMLKHKLT